MLPKSLALLLRLVPIYHRVKLHSCELGLKELVPSQGSRPSSPPATFLGPAWMADKHSGCKIDWQQRRLMNQEDRFYVLDSLLIALPPS